MIDLQGVKFWLNTPPANTDNGAMTSYACDTKGFDYATVIIALGATDIAMTALKLQESDDNSAYSDVAGTIFGTSTLPAIDGGTVSTLPTATDDEGMFAIFVNLKGRKRYLKVVANAGDGIVGTQACIITILSRAERSARTMDDRYLLGNLIV